MADAAAPLFSTLVSWSMVDQVDARGMAAVNLVVRQRRDGPDLILTIRILPMPHHRADMMVEASITTASLQPIALDIMHIPETFRSLATGIVRENMGRLLASRGPA